MPAATENATTSSALAARIAQARRETDELFGLLTPEAMYERPVAERHRLIFYLGHLEAFDWNLIARRGLNIPAFQPEFDQLFAFGIDPDSAGLPSEQASDWPGVDEVLAYNAQIRRTIDAVLGDAPETYGHVAIEHRLMHAETLAYLFHDLPFSAKIAAAEPAAPPAHPRREASCAIPAGVTTLGKARTDGFGWDNEFEETKIEVPAFRIDTYKVSNGEYLEFVNEGGPVPHRWSRTEAGWRLRTMFSEIALPLDWPAYVTQAQATAYALWKGKRLPTEAEYHRAAYGTPTGEERQFPWGSAEADGARHGNFDFKRWDPVAVTAHPAGDSAFGVAQLLGNGWEWTRDFFRPLPGFAKFEFYPGYSAPFFDDDHFVMKGASARTASTFLRRTFRNWFRAEYKYAYAGFRCVEDTK